MTLSIDGTRLEPGQAVELVLTLQARVATSLVAGAWLQADAGTFELLEPATTQLAPPNGVLHSEPRPLTDSEAQFRYRWTAPPEVGVTRFTLWAITGNSNGTPTDDNYTNALFYVAQGCEGTDYYQDADGDGFGATLARLFSCDGAPDPSYVNTGGDCDDASADVSPGSAEVCNLVDDNCDGEIDEGFTPTLLYPDLDGDGFGVSQGEIRFGCEEPGFAAEVGDCADSNPMQYPGAVELANGVDDNCNGMVDEGVAVNEAAGGAGGAPAGAVGGGLAVAGQTGMLGSAGAMGQPTQSAPAGQSAPTAAGCQFVGPLLVGQRSVDQHSGDQRRGLAWPWALLGLAMLPSWRRFRTRPR